MSLPGQIICKNLARRKKVATGLWINPGKDSSWRETANHCASISLFCQDFGAFRYHQLAGADVRFGAFPNVSDLVTLDIAAPALETRHTEERHHSSERQTFDWIILTLPRQKALLQ